MEFKMPKSENKKTPFTPWTDLINENKSKWYAVKLVDDKIYYGQISDIITDPIIISNWFIDYDDYLDIERSDNTLRLISGREIDRSIDTQNYTGKSYNESKISVARNTVVYMEPLKDDSKILQAIIDYLE